MGKEEGFVRRFCFGACKIGNLRKERLSMKKSLMVVVMGMCLMAGIASAQCCPAVASPVVVAKPVCPVVPPVVVSAPVWPVVAPVVVEKPACPAAVAEVKEKPSNLCATAVVSTGYYLTTRPATPVLVSVPAVTPCPAANEEAVEQKKEEASADIPEAKESAEEKPADESKEEVAAGAPCTAPCCAGVAYVPAKLKRKMVCTQGVQVTSTDVSGRPYTVTRRVSCQPRSIYYWD